jgi:hypothetical protein
MHKDVDTVFVLSIADDGPSCVVSITVRGEHARGGEPGVKWCGSVVVFVSNAVWANA